MKALMTDSHDRSDLCNEIDEFFRKRFRKINFNDAKEIIRGLGFCPDSV